MKLLPELIIRKYHMFVEAVKEFPEVRTYVLLVLSAFICVHLRPISLLGFGVGPEEKHIRPQMNADKRG